VKLAARIIIIAIPLQL